MRIEREVAPDDVVVEPGNELGLFEIGGLGVLEMGGFIFAARSWQVAEYLWNGTSSPSSV